AEMGCELAQGYGLCRPVSAERCAEVVRDAANAAPAIPKLRSVRGQS
ncbi:MAG: hypothetical protein H0U80_03835, partial [Solirubrobacterales bacterium]|nr:hypothetical protein [Solirubrobacterales bacterium]